MSDAGSKRVLAGRYRIHARIARGGMGAVFRAEDTLTGKPVALKVLSRELSSGKGAEEMHRRFRREASILEALDHDNLVRVLDGGTDDEGRAYTVMELLEGETLRQRLERPPPLSLAELSKIVASVASGLDAAHQHGVVHADVKPENIFMAHAPGDGPATPVKLVDFGLSKIHGLERLTRTGEVHGTPVYMAPEMFTGKAAIDERLDIYALGIVAYEALAGHPPFVERNPGKLLMMIATGAGHPLVEARPDLSAGVIEVIARAMAHRAVERFRSAPEFALALRDAASGEVDA